MPPRFLKVPDVCEVLNISTVQAYALLTSGELPAIQVGGRGQWRIEASELEAYIQRLYRANAERLEREHEADEHERSVPSSTDGDADRGGGQGPRV